MTYAVGTSIDLTHLNEQVSPFNMTVDTLVDTLYEPGTTVRFMAIAI